MGLLCFVVCIDSEWFAQHQTMQNQISLTLMESIFTVHCLNLYPLYRVLCPIHHMKIVLV